MEAETEAMRLQSEYRQKLDEVSAQEKEMQAQLSGRYLRATSPNQGDRLTGCLTQKRPGGRCFESLSETQRLYGWMNSASFPEEQGRQEFIHELTSGR